MNNWVKLRTIEGASQRVQEDTVGLLLQWKHLVLVFEILFDTCGLFTNIMGIVKTIKVLPFIGEVDHALVYVAVIFALFGTALLAAIGIKLPGLEFNNQKVEAAFRKELVFGEDHEDRAKPPTIVELFNNVRRNYFRLFFHYMYFDIAKWSYLQFVF